MGFFDKLKKMATAITGGGAKVSFDIPEARLDQPLTVNVTAVIEDDDVEIEKVYLKLRGEETVRMEVQVPQSDSASNDMQQERTKAKEISQKTQTYQTEIEVDGPQTLSAHQTYTWTCRVDFPEDARPTYHGIKARHEWKLKVGLSTFGNDPDSGWKVIPV